MSAGEAGALAPAQVPPNPTLQAVLGRIRERSDFPALSSAVARIQRITHSDHASVQMLADAILEDVALTQKLLRWVNAAYYVHAGGAGDGSSGSIGTISRAVALIGFAGVRNLALSLVLLEHLDDRAQARRLQRRFLRALLAGNVAAELAHAVPQSEEAFVSTLFQSLGELLLEVCLPPEARRIADGESAEQVIGLPVQELGVEVARGWGLPPSLLGAMTSAAGEPPRRAIPDEVERLRWLGRASYESAELLIGTPADRVAAQTHALAQRYAAVLSITLAQFDEAIDRVRDAMPRWIQALGLERDAIADDPAAPAPAPATATATATRPAPLDAAPRPAPRDAPAPTRSAALLTAGVQDISELLVADQPRLDDVMRVFTEAVFRALAPQRVVLCLRDGQASWLAGRFAHGAGAEAVRRAFRVPLSPQPNDLFSVICAKGADTLLADTRAGEAASRLPAWYRRLADAGSMLLLPMVVRQRCIGLLYADAAAPGGLQPTEAELSLLRTLRNQALMALRLCGEAAAPR